MPEVSGFNKSINNPLNSQNINRSGDVAQTGQVKGSQKVQRALDQNAVEDANKTQKQQPLPTIIRRMVPRDIVNQLVQLGIRPTAANRGLALKMLLNGLELSKQNFSLIESLTAGMNHDENIEQAAVILVNKGLPSRAAVQQLAGFLEKNPQLATQLNEVLANLAQVQTALAGQTLATISPQLMTQLAAVLASLEGYILALPKELKDKLSKGSAFLNRAELLTNMRAVRALVQGIEQQAKKEDAPSANTLLSSLAKLGQQAKDLTDSLMVQAVLSKPNEREDSAMKEQFAYWQIPNSLNTPPKNIDLLVQRDPRDRNRTINPRKTKLILKTETPALGEIAIEVDIDNDDLDFKFNSNDDEVRKLIQAEVDNLRQKVEALNYKTKSVRVVKRNLDVKKYLIPTLDMNSLTRVQTEV